MFDNKFLITLIGLIVAVVAVNNIKSKDEDVVEGLGMLPSFTYRTDVISAKNVEEAKKGNFTSLGMNRILNKDKVNTENLNNVNKGEYFTVPGTYQSHLNPRFSNTDYGANIRYNMPSKINQAVPTNPLTFGGMASKENFRTKNVKENFCSSCSDNSGVPSCGKGGVPNSYHGGAPVTEPSYASGNYNQVIENAYSKGNPSGNYGEKGLHAYSESSLPISDMTSASMNGEPAPVVYTRLMFANRANTRLRAQGDMIRGDLAIVPCDAGWFRPSVTPHVDLQQGALNVMGGIRNEQGESLDNLIFKSSGYTDTHLGGVNESRKILSGGISKANSNVNMSNQYKGGLSANQGDILVSAFP